MTSPTPPRDDAHGCEAFGHVASPFVDGELTGDEHERFATHLPACDPCRRLTAQYRALDIAARPPLPLVSGAQWDAAWLSIRAALVEDRQRASESPLAALARLWRRLWPESWSGALQPVAWTAAALALVAVLMTVQRDTPMRPADSALRTAPRVLAAARPPATEMRSVTCQAPDYMPIVYTLDGDDPLTVVQCVLVGNET